MNILVVKAQDRAFDEVLKLAFSGIEVRIKPPYSSTDEKVVEKYKDGLPADRWVNVSFRVKDRTELGRVFDAGDRLRKTGIYFETGGCKGRRDWELDWSFSLREKVSKKTDDAFAVHDIVWLKSGGPSMRIWQINGISALCEWHTEKAVKQEFFNMASLTRTDPAKVTDDGRS